MPYPFGEVGRLPIVVRLRSDRLLQLGDRFSCGLLDGLFDFFTQRRRGDGFAVARIVRVEFFSEILASTNFGSSGSRGASCSLGPKVGAALGCYERGSLANGRCNERSGVVRPQLGASTLEAASLVARIEPRKPRGPANRPALRLPNFIRLKLGVGRPMARFLCPLKSWGMAEPRWPKAKRRACCHSTSPAIWARLALAGWPMRLSNSTTAFRRLASASIRSCAVGINLCSLLSPPPRFEGEG